jgi:hypothetical protein
VTDMTRVLRLYQLPPELRREWETSYAPADVAPAIRLATWERLYAWQVANDRLLSKEVREAHARGERVPDTNFNRRALGLDPR